MSRKRLLSRALNEVGALALIRQFGARQLVIFNYHRIRPDQEGFQTPFDEGVYGPTQSEFDRHVGWLCKNSTVLTEDDLLEILDGRRPPSRLATMITFDDGYLDNYQLAYPVLKKHGAGAIFFIPSGLITRRRLGWWDYITYLVKSTPRTAIELRSESFPVAAQRERVIRKLIGWMKRKPEAETQGLLEELAEACGVDLPSYEMQDRELMTWDHIREMAAGGMSVGSHTSLHPVLFTLSEERQTEELGQSWLELKTMLGRAVRSLAYPVGGYDSFTAATQEIAARCGYQVAFSFGTGFNRWDSVTRMDVKRIEPSRDLDHLAGMATLPGILRY